MNDILQNLQEKISESNNQYRDILQRTKNSIENRTTVLVGGLVTLSNYESDFNDLTIKSKEMLSDKIFKVIEAYCVKDLRNVDNVNEQFIKKINDKLNKVELDTDDERQKFVDSLKKLLFEKYLDIVNIKRIPFFQENDDNKDIEDIVNMYTNSLEETNLYNDEKLAALFFEYKEDIYKAIKSDIEDLNKLFINNFITEIEVALSDNNTIKQETEISNKTFDEVQQDFYEEMPKIDEIPEPIIYKPEESFFEEKVEPVIEQPIIEEIKQPVIEEIEKPAYKSNVKIDDIFELTKPKEVSNTISIPRSEISIKEETSVDEDELVGAMIDRLTSRLEKVNQKEKEVEEERKRIKEDEKFLEELSDSTDKKAVSLDEKEQFLREKDIELKEKEKVLNEKLNAVLPFANAVLKSEETQ